MLEEQKGQVVSGVGPWVRYRRRDSRERSLVRMMVSVGVGGRRVARRVKSTSVGVCRREEVRLKMFSGEK